MGIGRVALAIGIGAGVFVGGMARLFWDHSTLDPINLKEATALAACFPTRGEIPTGTTVTVAQVKPKSVPARDAKMLSAEDSADKTYLDGLDSKPPASLKFFTSANFAVDLPDSASVNDGKLIKEIDVTIAKRAGADFSFELPSGWVEIRRSGTRSLLKSNSPVRFGPSDSSSYAITLPTDLKVQIDGQGRKVMVPAGAAVTLRLGEGQSLVALQPLSVAPWAHGVATNLVPLRASGPKGLGNLAIETRHPGLQFNSAVLLACVGVDENWQSAGVSDVKAREAGAATAIVTLPVNDKSWWPSSVATEIKIAVATPDGQYVGYGAIKLINRPAAAIIALLITGALFFGLLSLRWKDGSTPQGLAWYWGLFIGPDRDPSLSLFQIFIWTIITAWGLVYVFLATGTLLSLTPEMMVLLGIAGTGSVLARWIAERTPGGSTSQATGAPPTYEFWQMLSSKGEFDLLKLQLFVFTVMISLYVCWRILDTGAFPELDPNTLLLLGVSQGVYIGGKVAGTNPLSRANALKLELDVKKEALDQAIKKKPAVAKEKQDLTAAKAAHGAATPFPDEAKLIAVTNELEKLEKLEKELTENIKALQLQYEAAVKEMKLT